MKRTKRKTLVAAWILIVLTTITGCSGGTDGETITKVEGLEPLGDICVVTREEGSGTREVFAQKVNLMKSGENSTKDLIVSSAKVAMNAEAVMEQVATTENAIGFVSLGALPEQAGQVKVIRINGIEPNSKTIDDGSYDLSRNFNLGYRGKLSGVEDDFMRYILSAGQSVVENGYTKVKQATTFLSDKSKGEIVINGSTSMASLMKELAKSYGKYNKNAIIRVNTSDSTSGLTATMQGSSDLGMASRELKDYEKELLEYQTIAKDGVAVIVNTENPIESLAITQLYDIFSGKDTKWTDINQ